MANISCFVDTKEVLIRFPVGRQAASILINNVVITCYAQRDWHKSIQEMPDLIQVVDFSRLTQVSYQVASTTSSRLVIIKPKLPIQTHPDIGLITKVTSLLQLVISDTRLASPRLLAHKAYVRVHTIYHYIPRTLHIYMKHNRKFMQSTQESRHQSISNLSLSPNGTALSLYTSTNNRPLILFTLFWQVKLKLL